MAISRAVWRNLKHLPSYQQHYRIVKMTERLALQMEGNPK